MNENAHIEETKEDKSNIAKPSEDIEVTEISHSVIVPPKIEFPIEVSQKHSSSVAVKSTSLLSKDGTKEIEADQPSNKVFVSMDEDEVGNRPVDEESH